VAGRSRARAKSPFSRGRLLVGLVILTIAAAGLAYAFAKLRPSPDPGTLVYAGRQGVYANDLSGSGTGRKIAGLPDDVEAAMPSPDGKHVAYALGQGELWIASIGSEERFQVAQRFTFPLGWSPDGRFISEELLSDRDLVAIDPDGGRDVLLSGGYLSGSQPVWIDVDRFAIALDAERFAIVDGTERGDPIDGRPLAASPDGAELLVVADGKVVVGEVDGDALGDVRELYGREAAFAAASPGGFVAIATDDGVRVFVGGTRSWSVVDRPVDWIGWTRAGAVLLYAYDGAAYALDLDAEDGSEEGADPVRVTKRGVDVLPLLSFAVVP
jgi:outer membrane protein assembly factor BamB